MTDFKPEFSFGIDDGELDGLTPQQCFCLGYELAGLIERFKMAGTIVNQPVHSQNRERIERALAKYYPSRFKAEASFTFSPDDPSEEWLFLTVKWG